MIPHVFTIVLLLFPVLSTEPIPCTPCSCHNVNSTLYLTCENVDISNLGWNNLPHLETNAVFSNLTDFGFHQFPPIWGNLTKSLTVSDVLIEDFDLCGFNVIQKLHISNAVIVNQNHIITVQKSLREVTISNTNLSFFNLNTHAIDDIPGSSQLSKLVLRDNQIRTLFTSSCTPVKGITLLDFSGNRLTEVPENAFDCIISPPSASAPMLTVDLSRNAIRTIHPRAFVNIDIEKLDLSNNQLRNIDSDALDWKNWYINLQHNPWNCGCHNQWMLEELVPFMYISSPHLLNDMRCGSPRNKRGRLLKDWIDRTDQVFCQSSDANDDFFSGDGWSLRTIVVVILGCVCLLMSVVVVLFSCLRDQNLLGAKNCARRMCNGHYSLIYNERSQSC